MTDILHRIVIDAPPERILPALATSAGLRSRWTDDCEAVPREGSFRFHGGAVEFHFCVNELADRRLVWTCVAGPRVPAEVHRLKASVEGNPRGPHFTYAS